MGSLTFRQKSPLDLASVRIGGNRITLLPIDESFAPGILREFTEEITRYMLPKPAESIDDALAFISASIEGMRKRSELVLVITKRESGEFLGCCGLHGRGKPEAPELGIWLKKDAHGHQYGREAIEMLTKWAIENIDFDYMIYPVDKANIPSRMIPEALGGTAFEEKRVETMNGTYLDEVVYRLPREVLKQHHG